MKSSINNLLNSLAINNLSQNVALIEGKRQLSYAELLDAATDRANYLKQIGAKRVATILDNSIDWILFDLACQRAQLCFVPLPHFFTEKQIQHALSTTSIDTLFVDEKSKHNFGYQPFSCPFEGLVCLKKDHPKPSLIPDNTSKITFTSGSTGNPKGVCLSIDNQMLVANSLVKAIAINNSRHLCLLPLSTLLENIAGVYAPLLSGGTVIVADSKTRGLSGSSMLDPEKLLETISLNQPNSLILVPELLLLLVRAVEQGWQPPRSLKFIAVGGSKVSAALLSRASKLNLPVFQGYGLSESASVVCLCTPSDNQLGTVGKPLAHLQVELEDNQLIVTGNSFLGYVNAPDSWYPKRIETGDLGDVDSNGNYSISGRKKNLIISSFGRNISPEWIESECLQNGVLNQCVVFGDAKPWSVSLVSPTNPDTADEDINSWIKQVNNNLPDYAQIKNWLRIPNRFTHENGLLTENGRPKREAIEQYYKFQLNSLFSTPHYSYD